MGHNRMKAEPETAESLGQGAGRNTGNGKSHFGAEMPAHVWRPGADCQKRRDCCEPSSQCRVPSVVLLVSECFCGHEAHSLPGALLGVHPIFLFFFNIWEGDGALCMTQWGFAGRRVQAAGGHLLPSCLWCLWGWH